MTKMTTEERAWWDAKADHEAWSYAHEIMGPWMAIVRSIGNDELTRVMEPAFARVEREVGRASDVAQDFEEGVDRSGAYRSALERISRDHGFSGAEEVARLAAELTPGVAAKRLLTNPEGGFGEALDKALNMTDAEKYRIACAWSRTFMSAVA